MQQQVAILSKKDIHQVISNFICNDLQISKQDIISVMEKNVEKVLESKLKDFLNSKYFTALVERTIVSIIKEGVDNGYFGKTPFEKFFVREISSQVRKMVSEKYEVKVEQKSLA